MNPPTSHAIRQIAGRVGVQTKAATHEEAAIEPREGAAEPQAEEEAEEAAPLGADADEGDGEGDGEVRQRATTSPANKEE